MAFMMEFLTNTIKRSMEDPVARREARDVHLTTVKADADNLCVPLGGRLHASAAAGVSGARARAGAAVAQLRGERCAGFRTPGLTEAAQGARAQP
jgi:hypothetical protein